MRTCTAPRFLGVFGSRRASLEGTRRGTPREPAGAWPRSHDAPSSSSLPPPARSRASARASAAARHPTTAATRPDSAIGEGEFDYIVIGSGAGGGPVACRLAQAGFSVCILEAGGDRGKNFTYQVPAYHGQSTEDPSMQWDYFVDHWSDPAKAKRDPKRYEDPSGAAQRKGIYYPRAGTLGGCTAHNAMITLRPHDADWNDIAEDHRRRVVVVRQDEGVLPALRELHVRAGGSRPRQERLARDILPKTAELVLKDFGPAGDRPADDRERALSSRRPPTTSTSPRTRSARSASCSRVT